MGILVLLITLIAASAAQQQSGRNYWESTARDELEASLKVVLNKGLAKNVVIFVGDGMGPNTITAARIYKSGESSYLSWERFPHVGVLKTYCEDKTVPDSAATATAMFTGVKVNYNVVGLSSLVKEYDCDAAQNDDAKLTHLTTLAQAAGKSTGIVTTARVTHATPSALYAHSPTREWECWVPDNATRCKDIGRQLVENLPGKNLNVIMGGGQYMMQSNVTTEEDPMDRYCTRKDGRDLIAEWAKEKASRNLTYAVVNNTKSLKSVDYEKTDYLMGVFAKNHLKFHYDRNTTDEGTPSLAEMTTAALKVLMKNKKGFFLMVEAEHIDLAHHQGTARISLSEVLALNDAINETITRLKDAGVLDETLVIVTSDHSHTLSLNGYPYRGTSILGLAGIAMDGVPFTTLSYANGGDLGYHYKTNGTSVVRENPMNVNTSDWNYHAQNSVYMERNTHGGNDVLIYAMGPYGHLFHHLHEQNYVYSVVKYAARLGEFSNSTYYEHDETPQSSSPTPQSTTPPPQSSSPPLSTVPFFFLISAILINILLQ